MPNSPKRRPLWDVSKLAQMLTKFVLVNDEKTTYQVHAAEGVEIAPHANHRVELTGTVEKTESTLIFKAKALKMLSTSCTG